MYTYGLFLNYDALSYMETRKQFLVLYEREKKFANKVFETPKFCAALSIKNSSLSTDFYAKMADMRGNQPATGSVKVSQLIFLQNYLFLNQYKETMGLHGGWLNRNQGVKYFRPPYRLCDAEFKPGVGGHNP